MTILQVTSPSTLLAFGQMHRCATGRGGFSDNKQEGDGATPIGTFPLRRVFYRPDRLLPPTTGAIPLAPEMGWCDDPQHPAYNTLIQRPFAARHEQLWRDDAVYNIIIEVGYNDSPAVPQRGSAIFIHLARLGYPPTEGCVALSEVNLRSILAQMDKESEVFLTVHAL